MFDVGISEIMVIAVVALVVIGPERLPRVARVIGTMLGRAQRYVADVKAEVTREMELEELRKLQAQMKDAAQTIQQQVSSAGAEVQSAVSGAEQELNRTLAEASSLSATDSATSAVPLPEVTPLAEPPGTPLTSLTSPEVADAATAGTLPEPPAEAAVAGATPSVPADSGTAGALETASAVQKASAPAQSTLFPEHTIR